MQKGTLDLVTQPHGQLGYAGKDCYALQLTLVGGGELIMSYPCLILTQRDIITFISSVGTIGFSKLCTKQQKTLYSPCLFSEFSGDKYCR